MRSDMDCIIARPHLSRRPWKTFPGKGRSSLPKGAGQCGPWEGTEWWVKKSVPDRGGRGKKKPSDKKKKKKSDTIGWVEESGRNKCFKTCISIA